MTFLSTVYYPGVIWMPPGNTETPVVLVLLIGLKNEVLYIGEAAIGSGEIIISNEVHSKKSEM